MTTPPSRDNAIKFAIQNKWNEAYRENKRLLLDNPDDIDTLNRTAYSLVKLGKFNKAKLTYQKVIKIDKTNPIASKNLKRLENLSKGAAKKNGENTLNQHDGVNIQDLFIEEAGKTKTVELKNVADKKTLSMLQSGDSILLTVKRSKVFVQMSNKAFVGMLPDSVGMRVVPLINAGNEYSGCVKALGENSVIIFIKETKRIPKFKNYPSFVPSVPSKTK